MATLLKHKDVITSKNVAYRKLFILAVFDMVFMDMVLIVLRAASLVWMAFFGFTETMAYAFALVMLIYTINESIAFLAAGLCSPKKGDLKYVYLLPFIFLVYRPAYAAVRLYAIVSAFIKKDIKWQ